MFSPQQQDDELLFDEPSMVLEQDLNTDQHITKTSKKRPRTSKSGAKLAKKCVEEKKDSELRKTMHREIERQRRQEMSTLYASLRDLLPLEYIKGKRSVSDHMHESANYIKHIEKRIDELQLRKDNLMKNVPNLSGSQNGGLNSAGLPNYVTLNYCCEGIEVLINCGIKEGYGFALSSVLVELIQTGLDVVSCISNKVNGRFLHKIQTQVSALAYIDLPELHQRLVDVIK